jgi:peptidoglycan/LPS O-acetylase OafA/YrhL
MPKSIHADLLLRQSPASVHLDALRGLAALAVLLGHVRLHFFVPYHAVSEPSILTKLLYLLAAFGHQAVMIFFVLSGYLISSSVLSAWTAHKWNWHTYAVSRLSRLYVVLLPALLLTSMWDQAGLRWFGWEGGYVEANPDVVGVGFAERMRLGVWLGNALFLQEILCRPLGSNGTLWSLSYEFWYYVAFPLAVGLLWRGQPLRRRLLLAVLLLAALGVMNGNMRRYFLIWLMGTAVAILPAPGRLVYVAARVVAPLGLLASLALARAYPRLSLPDFAIGLFFAGTMYCLLHGRMPLPARWYRGAARALSGCSYTLYLTHTPFLLFLAIWLVGASGRWQPDLRHVLSAGAIVVLVGAYTAVVWALTEAHYVRVRHWLLDRIQALAVPA